MPGLPTNRTPTTERRIGAEYSRIIYSTLLGVVAGALLAPLVVSYWWPPVVTKTETTQTENRHETAVWVDVPRPLELAQCLGPIAGGIAGAASAFFARDRPNGRV